MRKPRVLIVEFDDELRMKLKRAFLEEGWDVTCASYADNAVRSLYPNAYDFVVSGLRLRGMDGCEWLNLLKAMRPAYSIVLTREFSDQVNSSSFPMIDKTDQISVLLSYFKKMNIVECSEVIIQ